MKECPHCLGQIIDEAVKCKHCGAWLKSYDEMMEDKVHNEHYSDEQSQYASLLSRVIGTFIDGVIVLIMFLITIYLLNKYNLSNALSISIVIFIYYIVYFTWPISQFAQTPGYMFMKIKVIKSDGSNLGIIRSFFRYFVKTLLGIISMLTYGFSKKKQSIHDMIVDSIVVYK